MNAPTNQEAAVKIEDLVRYVATEQYKATQKRNGMLGMVTAFTPSGLTATVLFEDGQTVHCATNHLVLA